jgi:hypothetical protein
MYRLWRFQVRGEFMRIINRHFTHLLVGYDRIQEYSKAFDANWLTQCQTLEQAYRQQLDGYNQRFALWQAEKTNVDARYNRAYDAWYASDKPYRDAYQHRLDGWIKRWSRAIDRIEKQLEDARAQQKNYRTLFWIAAALSLLILPALVTLPAAVAFYIIYRQKGRVVKSLVYRRNDIHSIQKPAYRPMTPAPPKPFHPPEPVRPMRKTVPEPKKMTAAWWDILAKDPPGVTNPVVSKNGDAGEALLLEELARVLPDDFLAIHGAFVEPSTDADVIVIGKNGIWVLDSKYFAGWVRYNPRQGWSHETLVYIKGGKGAQEIVPKEVKDISGEWQREKNSVEFTLKKHMHRPHPPITGGIAFTYTAERRIVDCPVATLTATEWARQIASVPADPQYSERDLVECAHHILTYSHRMEGDNTGSAADAALALKDAYEHKLR